MEINNVTIGNRIKELRTSKNLTQEDIAKMVKVSKATISNYEKGKVSPPIELLIKLAERYDNHINISAPKTPCVPYKNHKYIYRYIGINTDFSAVHFFYKSLFHFRSAYLTF